MFDRRRLDRIICKKTFYSSACQGEFEICDIGNARREAYFYLVQIVRNQIATVGTLRQF